jgi:hypothetical protein
MRQCFGYGKCEIGLWGSWGKGGEGISGCMRRQGEMEYWGSGDGDGGAGALWDGMGIGAECSTTVDEGKDEMLSRFGGQP